MDTTNTHSSAISAVTRLNTAGLVLSVGDSPVRVDQAVTEAADTGKVAIYLGKLGRTSHGLFPVVLELPAAKTDNEDAILSAVERLGCSKLWHRLDQAWTISAERGVRSIYLGVSAPSEEDFEIFIRTLPARVATRDGVEIARLLFGKSNLVDVEGAVVSGDLSELLPISANQLAGIGAVLDEASDARDRMTRGWYDVREHDQGTNRIRDAFNRSTSEFEMSSDLIRLGWNDTGDPSAPVQRFRRDALEGDLVMDSRTFVLYNTPGASLKTTAQVLRHFDVLAHFDPKYAGKLNGAEDLAAWLLADGQVSPERGTLIARERPLVEPNQSYPDLVDAFSSALSQSRSRSDARMPLAFAKTANGEWDAVVSITPHGDVHRWDARNLASLILAAAQPARSYRDKETGAVRVTYKHNVEPSVVQGVERELKEPGALPPLEVVAAQPILTADGEIAADPGYHRAAKAYVAIPHRQRSAWRRDFKPILNASIEEVQEAYQWMRTEITGDIPFQSHTDEARYFAYLFTCAFRHLMAGSIGFAASAMDRGVGKSLCLMVGRLIGQGHPGYGSFRVGRWADEETEKKLASLLRGSGTFFHCDEVPRNEKVTGVVLTEALTSIDGEKQIRLLGSQDHVRQTSLIVTLAGSSMDLGGDMNRRFMQINLEWKGGGAPVGRSGFRHANLATWVVQNRPAILARMFTIMRYFLVNGASHKVPGLGFNHNWSEMILGALSNLVGPTGASVAEEALEGWLDDVNEQDDLGDEWGSVMAELWRSLGQRDRFMMDDIRTAILAAHSRSDRPYLPTQLQGLVTNPSADNRAWAAALRPVTGATIPDIDSGCTFRLRPTERHGKSKKSATYTVVGFDKRTAELDPKKTLPRDGLTQLRVEPEWNAIVAHLSQHPKMQSGATASDALSLVKASKIPLPPRLGGLNHAGWETHLTNIADGAPLSFAESSHTLTSELRGERRYFIAAEVGE